MLNINMLDFVLNYTSKKTKKKKKGLEHEVFLRAFIQNTSQICEWISLQNGVCQQKWNTLCHAKIDDRAAELSEK